MKLVRRPPPNPGGGLCVTNGIIHTCTEKLALEPRSTYYALIAVGTERVRTPVLHYPTILPAEPLT
ncbi:hypothetical protein SAMN06265222_10113 [Neorhodopirellula lusitana]|uniref:Uncharacterized protein n=1 Tax=Neorhodopirellula lusitana TaxID=445327 RepID=A0ABY1PQH9_9BACT|nr:hypothetical protein SAMN06265222_10113 [Neorhodopirellula lusitana]